jgi:5-methylcytosine-specific restriction endonuclease McrA
MYYNTLTHKNCKDCLLDIPIENFYLKFNRENNKSYISSRCKKCQNIINKSKRIPVAFLSEEDKEKRRKYMRDKLKLYRKLNKDKYRSYDLNRKGSIKRKLSAKRSRDKIRSTALGRANRKKEKANRRSYEKLAGKLETSSIVNLENYNLKQFSSVSSFKCEFCKKDIGNNYHLEHLVPLSKQGTNIIENLAISCPECNLRKAIKTYKEFRPDLIEYFFKRNKEFNLSLLNE